MYNILRLGTVCNQNCIFCFNKFMKSYELSIEEAKEAVSSLSEIQKEYIIFSGGEPTLYQKLPELISYAKNLGFKIIGIQTNGLKLEDCKCLKTLADEGLNYVYISIHSSNPDVSNEITGVNGGFYKTLKALRNALDLGLYVETNYVINSKNYKDILSFVKLIGSFSERIIIEFSYALPLDNKEEDKKFLPRLSDIKPFLVEALDYCSSNGIKFRISSCSIPYCFCGNHLEGCVELKHMTGIKNRKETVPDYEHIPGMSSERRGANLWSTKRKKVVACEDCALSEVCNGIWRGYLEIYGEEEIKPILEVPKAIEKKYLGGYRQIKKEIILLDINRLDNISEIKNNSRLAFTFKEKDLNERNGEKIIQFLQGLDKKKINFHIMNPLPRCLFGLNYFKIIKKFNIPKNCTECFEKFSLNEDKRVVYCNILSNMVGPKLEYFRDENQICEYFKTFYDELKPFEKCKSCLYFLRKKCDLCNRETKK